MNLVRTQRTLFVAALFAVAGCNGASTPMLSGSQNLSAYVHHGVPIGPAMHNRGASIGVHPAYSTSGSLVYEGDQAEAKVNIYQTSKLTTNPAPIASITVSHGCPYGVLADKSGTIYVADNCGG